MKEILILISSSSYDREYYFASVLAKYLKNLFSDTTCAIVPLSSNAPADLINDYTSSGCDLIISFNGLGFNISSLNEDLFFNCLTCPCITIFTDSYFLSTNITRLSNEYDMNINLAVAVSNPYDCNYLQENFHNVSNVFSLFPPCEPEGNTIPWEERDIEIFCPSSYVSSQNLLEKIDTLSPAFQQIAHKVIEIITLNNTIHIKDALIETLTNLNFEYTSQELQLLLTQFSFIQEYFYFKSLENTLAFFEANNIPVTVCGKGWQNFFSTSDSITYIGSFDEIPYTDTLTIMKQSKFVLDLPYPGYQNMPTDRTIQSIFNGAIPVSTVEEVQYYENNPQDAISRQQVMKQEFETQYSISNILKTIKNFAGPLL
ncbi:hypothetical protein [Velocimicrobium porci]|uniref:Glycosyltransferase n=1 Tax=Velocimicrobium porci TaxID=2606634 RepID=A0A6L5Y128_9FIRM|nr:hypothetical protein [Velocimicrobium porci]MSS63863.1 hypothetical protein [Velocimicrobium porci]